MQASMQTVEITAKTVQEATKAAAEKLGVATGALTVTVLEETKGLFGKSSVRIAQWSIDSLRRVRLGEEIFREADV